MATASPLRGEGPSPDVSSRRHRVMDNLGSHRGRLVRQLIRSAGAKLFFLPKYSPDLNPIEQVFAKLKHFLRRAAARAVEAVCLAIGEVPQLFTPEECLSYLANAGYGRT
jgi:transposase